MHLARFANVVAFALSLALASAAAMAQEQKKHVDVDTATVKAVDPEAKTVTVAAGDDEVVYVVEDVTRIRVGDDEIAIGELEAGARVAVSARPEGANPEGRLVADVIQVVKEDTQPEDAEQERVDGVLKREGSKQEGSKQ